MIPTNTQTTLAVRPFMIVSAPYIDFEGKVKTFMSGDVQRALFLVLRVDNDGHVLACKITSQVSKFLNEYTYFLSKMSHDFLMTDSYIQLDKWHTLLVSECTPIGSVLPKLREGIKHKFDTLSRDVSLGLADHTLFVKPTKYQSPNVRSRYSRPYPPHYNYYKGEN
jgi:hypothetical protein